MVMTLENIGYLAGITLAYGLACLVLTWIITKIIRSERFFYANVLSWGVMFVVLCSNNLQTGNFDSGAIQNVTMLSIAQLLVYIFFKNKF